MAEYTIEIDIFDIDKGLNKFDNYINAVEDAIQDAIAEVMWRAENKMFEKLSEYGLIGSELSTHCYARKTGRYSFVLVGGTDYAMYVEFGTGIMGGEDPHPEAMMDYRDEGWWYPTENPYPGQWHFVGRDGNTIAYTEGMPSRPFMYETQLYIRRILTKTVNKHLGRIKV